MWAVILQGTIQPILIKIQVLVNHARDILSFIKNVPSCGYPKCKPSVHSLSTMESEYFALSQSMQDLIPLREILKEINKVLFNKEVLNPKGVTNSKSFSDIVSDEDESPISKSNVYEDNNPYLKFARLPRLTPRTKRITAPYHWFRSKVEQLEISIDTKVTNMNMRSFPSFT